MAHQAAHDDAQDLGNDSGHEQHPEASLSNQHENTHDADGDAPPLALADESDDSRCSVCASDIEENDLDELKREEDERNYEKALLFMGDPYTLQARDERHLAPWRFEYYENPIEDAFVISGKDRDFPKFLSLPTELRHMIWKFAIPSPQSFDLGILGIVNFNLAKPHRILSKNIQRWSSTDPGFLTLFSLLHSCGEARSLVLASYKFDFASSVPGETKVFWKPEDTIYYPLPLHGPSDSNTSNYWIEKLKGLPRPPQSTLRHLALDIGPLARWFNFLAPSGGADALTVDVCWLKHFPLLESITFVLDPGFVRLHDHGKLVLRKAMDVPLRNYRGLKPWQLEKRAVECVEHHSAVFGGAVPAVQLAVVCWVKPKQEEPSKYGETDTIYQDLLTRVKQGR